MFDWTAKITRLLELPGLTDEERGVLEEHLLWHSPELSGNSRLTPYPFPERVLERPIQGFLEELVEAREARWDIGTSNKEFYADVFRKDHNDTLFTRGATPAQAFCDAILAALEEAPHV